MKSCSTNIKYTRLGLSVDEKIQEYVDIIVEEILKEIPSVKSIILGGGFGRGEGSVEVRKGKVIPINDFDIFIISENKVSEESLNRIANRATSRLDIKNTGVEFYEFDRERYSNTFYVDLKNLPVGKLKNLPPMARYYELKNSGSVIYGDDLRNLMPSYTVEDLPLTEGFRFLMNRMALLAEYFSMDYFHKISENEKRGLLYLGYSKALIACCEALLMLNRKFVPGYKKRAEILEKCFKKDFPELAKKIPDLPEKVMKATDFKLNTKFPKKINAFKEWHEACHYSGEVAKYFVGKFTGRKIKDYEHLSDVIYNNTWKLYFGPYIQWYIRRRFKINLGKTIPSFLLQNYMKLIFYLRLRKFRKTSHLNILKNKTSPDLTMYAVLPRLLFSVSKEKKINKRMLKDAGKMMNKVFPTDYSVNDSYKLWNEIANKFSQAYVLFCFLKIV